MRTFVFAKRNFKELIRDPFNIFFCLVFPLFLLVIFQQFDIPNEVYNIANFAPSIIVFSFGFISLFTSQLLAKDRSTSLLTRLYASPLKSSEYLLGYTLSLLPIVITQIIIFLVAGSIMGMNLHHNILLIVLGIVPLSLLFISLGLIIGAIFSDKQAPGFGSIIIQLIAFTSGMWFDINTMSNGFKIVCDILPFRYAIDISRFLVSGGDLEIKAIIISVVFTIVSYIIATLLLKRCMTKDNK